ncbi:MAG: hypothetical protein EOO63_06625 [Hymenobacter sp.]|nr:MAG: hypothetical protein EOO63_06625 [Hymenobacter sp.]
MARLLSNPPAGYSTQGKLLGCLLLLLLSFPPSSWAQRHDKRITGLGIVYGGTDNGRFLEGSWTRYVSDKTYLRERSNEDGAAPDQSGVQQHFYGGPLLGLETDIFLGNRVSVVGTVQKAFVLPDDGLARWPGYYGVGLRYHLR